MGRQFSFFLTRADALLFEQALLADDETCFLPSRPLSPHPAPLRTSIRSEESQGDFRILLVRKTNLEKVTFRPIPTRSEFTADSSRELIVEFDRCYLTSDLIRCGRLYVVPTFFDQNDTLVTKPIEFLDWAARLFRRSKKVLTYLGFGYYAGPEALRNHAAGTNIDNGIQEFVFEDRKLNVFGRVNPP